MDSTTENTVIDAVENSTAVQQPAGDFELDFDVRELGDIVSMVHRS